MSEAELAVQRWSIGPTLLAEVVGVLTELRDPNHHVAGGRRGAMAYREIDRRHCTCGGRRNCRLQLNCRPLFFGRESPGGRS